MLFKEAARSIEDVMEERRREIGSNTMEWTNIRIREVSWRRGWLLKECFFLKIAENCFP